MNGPSTSLRAGKFVRVLKGGVEQVPPIWLMRQAGRYQASYQKLRQSHTFEDLCRVPDLAAEVALAPIREFDFDAAILFSDLLFPLEALGFGLSYASGPPKLTGEISFDFVKAFRSLDDALARLVFQRDAMRTTRAILPADRGLLGFVGGPWTLFVYAMEGTHAGTLARSKAAFDLYRAFADRMVPLLIENIRLQFEGGADVVMVLDTAAGELAPGEFQSVTLPDLAQMAVAFPGALGYYAKGSTPDHVDNPAFGAIPWAGIGIDMTWDLAPRLARLGRTGILQGNFDPEHLRLPAAEFRRELDRYLTPLRALDAETRRGWICGLGHGVLQHTPEDNVRTFVHTVRESFA
jgi:uroporphyrinogen decarboxylase